MSTFSKFGGNNFKVTPTAAMAEYAELPAQVYTVNMSPQIGYFLTIVESFTLPKKLYGDHTAQLNRILDTFSKRSSSTGVLLEGRKGSGKTLLAKNIAIDAIAMGIPVIVINSPHCGEAFNQFIQSIDQPAVIIFDEFEKVYNDDGDDQDAILTLLDGVYPTKKLFLLTVNDSNAVNRHMIDRPGRLFYRLKFGNLADNFVREYADENLINKDHIEGLINVCGLVEDLNFDSLQALVEEMNRYNESAKDALVYLNVSVARKYLMLKGTLSKDGVVLNNEVRFQGYPLSERVGAFIPSVEPELAPINVVPQPTFALTPIRNDDGWAKPARAYAAPTTRESITFTSIDIIQIDGIAGRYVWAKDGYRLDMSIEPAPKFDVSDLL